MGHQVKNNLQALREALEHFDNDPTNSLFFYNNPRARTEMMKSVLWATIIHGEGINDPVLIDLRFSEIVGFLDRNFQAFAWPAHEVHFHTNFMQHSECPFTCLNEISTILEKLIKEKFAA